MKKLLSLALTIVMVMSLVVTVTPVSADTTSDNLIFSMDLSGSTESQVVVTDGATDSVEEKIAVPETGFAVDTVEGKQTKYLKVSDADQAGIKIVDTDVNALGKKDITLEMWTKADSNSATGVENYTEYVFTLHNGSRHNLQFTRSGENVNLDSQYTSSQARVTVTKPEQTEWTHWVITRTYDDTATKGTLTAYRNGVQCGSAQITKEMVDTAESGAMYIGGAATYNATWSNPFVGGIGACNVYGKALSAAEVKAKYDDSAENYYTLDNTGLVFSMDLSESTESQVAVKDKTADLVNETITIPSAGLAVDTVDGKDTKYLKVSAANQAGIKIVDEAVNALGRKDITLEMWTKADSNTATDSTEFVFTLHNGSRHNLKYARNGADVYLENEYTSGYARVTVAKPEQTEWTHWVLTRTYDETSNTGTLTAYKNGAQCGTTAINGELADTSTNGAMYIGGAHSYIKTWGNPFIGGIGACNVYNKVLSADEVKAKYDDSAEDYYTLDKTGLVFDMDLSGYSSTSTDTAKGIVDATADLTNETFTLPANISVEPISEGSNINALKLEKGAHGGILASDSGVDAAASSNTMTVETWMKVNGAAGKNSGAGHALLYTDASAAHNWQILPLVSIDSKTGDVAGRSITDTVQKKTVSHTKLTFDEWAHYVFTREYDTTAQTCTVTLYVNGVQKDQQVLTGISGPQAMSGGLMHIGGGTYNNGAVVMDGEMTTFKVYNRVLDETEVKGKYLASVEDYYTLDKTGLVFDMDLSGYDADSTAAAKGIVDATADLTDETFTLPANISVGPISEGSAINALKLEKGAHNGILASDSDVDAAASSNAMTVETWMKVESDKDHNNGAGHALLYTDASLAHNWQILPVVNVDSKTGEITGRSITNTVQKSNTVTYKDAIFDEWAHYVFTREYDTAAQTCTVTLYVNGVQKDQQVLTGISGPQAMSGGLMHIGGGTYNSGAVVMDGEMATFKVYNRALGECEVFSKYADSASGFGYEVLGEGFSIIDLEWTPTEIGSTTTDVSVDFNVVNTTESKELFCFLTVYDEDGNMVACDVDADVTVGGDASVVPVSLSVTGLTPAPGYFAKLYIWGKNDIEPFTDGSGKIVYPY